MLAWAGMLAAIDFDDQPRFDADEIDHIGWNRELAPEAPAQLMLSKLPPQHALGVCQIAAQFSRPVLDCRSAAHVDPARAQYPHPNPPPLAGEGIAPRRKPTPPLAGEGWGGGPSRTRSRHRASPPRVRAWPGRPSRRRRRIRERDGRRDGSRGRFPWS